MNKSEPYKPLLARCRAATKNGNAAQLLYRIAFWMRYAKIQHDGMTWSANSAAQWCEQTELTLDQYRRAVSLLRKLDLIETSQHLFGRKNITHVRLTEKASQLFADPSPEECNTAPPADGDSAQPEMGEDAQLYIQGESDLEDQHGNSTIAFAKAHAEDTSTKNSKKCPGKSNSNDNEYIIQNNNINQSGKKKSANVDPDSTHGLANLWTSVVNETTGDYVPEFNVKQLKQLKSFRAACPPGRAPEILDACLRNWPYVVEAAKAQGAINFPLNPSLGFLLKFATEAINVGLDQLKPKTAPTSIKSKKWNYESDVDVAEEPSNGLTHNSEHRAATSEEISEILKSDYE